MAKWKKNFRKIPDRILKKVDKQLLVVAVSKKIKRSDIESNIYQHLGIKIVDGQLVFLEKIIPSAITGKFSNKNINGYEIVRKDLPMIQKTRSFDSPNYGDWSRGSHEVSWDQDVYQRDFYPPKELSILVKLLKEDVEDGEPIFIFKFSIDEIFNPDTQNFTQELLFALNLLQENVGSSDIYEASAQDQEYLKEVTVNWEILPIGSRESDIEKILSKYRFSELKDRKKIEDRYDLLKKLNPKLIITGTDGFRRYFGFQFTDDLVAFENIEYGNAIYVMYQNWQSLSRLSRMELWKMKEKPYDRIVHGKRWKEKLKKLIHVKIKS